MDFHDGDLNEGQDDTQRNHVYINSTVQPRTRTRIYSKVEEHNYSTCMHMIMNKAHTCNRSVLDPCMKTEQRLKTFPTSRHIKNQMHLGFIVTVLYCLN